MQKSKLISILKTFSKEEWIEFEKLVASPYFNRGRNLIAFVKELKKFYPEFNNPKLTREYIYTKVHKGKSYKDNTMKKVLTLLLEMAKELIRQVSIRDYSGFTNCFFAYETNYRNLDFLTNEFLNKAEIDIENYKVDQHYFAMKFYYQLGQMTRNLHFDRQKLVCDDVIAQSNFDIYLFFSKMCINLNNIVVNNINYNWALEETLLFDILKNLELKKIIQMLEKRRDKYTELVEIYIYLIICYLNAEDADSVTKLKDLIYSNIQKFNTNEKHSIIVKFEYVLQRNSLEARVNYKEYNNIINYILENNLHKYSLKEFFPAIKFLGYFNIILESGELHRAETFLKKYSDELNPEIKNEVVKLCMASLKFEEKDFEQSLNYIKDIQPDIFQDKFLIRVLQLKIFYEMNYIEEALSALDSYMHFLSENKSVSNTVKLTNQNFAKYYKTLVKLKTNRDFAATEWLRKEIFNEKKVSARKWLLGKTEELISSH